MICLRTKFGDPHEASTSNLFIPKSPSPSLKDIQNLVNQSDQLYLFQDITNQIETNITSLKQILIPLDNNANNIKNDLDTSDLSLPPLKTYRVVSLEFSKQEDKTSSL